MSVAATTRKDGNAGRDVQGNSPRNGEVEDILAVQGLGGEGYIPMRVPCAGRIPTNFIFNALKSGMKNIVSIQCHDGFCRMKEGTRIGTRRMLLGQAVISQLGYPEDTLKVVKYSRKAVRDNKECVGCGKCVFICPYDAIRRSLSPRPPPTRRNAWAAARARSSAPIMPSR